MNFKLGLVGCQSSKDTRVKFQRFSYEIEQYLKLSRFCCFQYLVFYKRASKTLISVFSLVFLNTTYFNFSGVTCIEEFCADLNGNLITNKTDIQFGIIHLVCTEHFPKN